MRQKIKITSQKLVLSVSVFIITFSGLVFTKTAAADPLGAITRGPAAVTQGTASEGNDGRIWFPGYRGEMNAMDKNSTTITTYTFDSSNTYPAYTTVRGSDGNIWFTYNNKLARITPSGNVTSFTIPSVLGQPQYLATDSLGNIRVSSWNPNADNNYIYTYYVSSFSTSGSFLSTVQVPQYVYSIKFDYKNNQLDYLTTNINAHNSQVVIGRIQADNTLQTTPTGVYGDPSTLVHLPNDTIWFGLYNSNTTTGSIYQIDQSNTVAQIHTFPYAVQPNAYGLDGNVWATSSTANYILRLATTTTPSTTITSYYTGSTQPSGIFAGSDGNMWFTEPGNLRMTRIGTGVTTSTVDSDGDGLNAQQELAQGTSDYSADTDNDGLSDYLESTSNSNRNSLFCNATASYCEYPSPTQRDIYIETDWMYKPSPSNYSMQPNTTQVNAIKSSYAAKGIVAHVDTGQLGGGNQVPYRSMLAFHQVTGVPDYYDYKYGGDGVSAQFNTNRLQVYHYVLLVDRYPDDTGIFHTGASYPGDDDTIVAYGEIKDYSSSLYTSFDTALAGTIFHELGHTLCLTDGTVAAYPSQPASCRFSGIDAYSGSAYPSSMNYDYQLSLVNYSVGSGSSDHDDWSALRLSDFATQNNASDPGWGLASAGKRKNIKRVNTKPVVGPTVKELRSSKSLHR